MKLQKNVLAHSIALCLLTTSVHTFAGSFALITQSLSSLSMANAGSAVNTDNATVLYTNPAGMTQLTQAEVSVGLAPVNISTTITNASSTLIPKGSTTGISTPTAATDTNDGNAFRKALVPLGYYVTPLDLTYLKNISAGIGVYGSYGFNAKYENTFAGRLFGEQSKLKVTTYAPSVAYKVNATTSIGASATLNDAKAYLSSATYFSPGNNFSVKGSDTAPGYTLGLLVKPNDNVNLGAVYRSAVKFYLLANQGDVKFSAPTTAGQTLLGQGHLHLTTPSSIELAASYRVMDVAKVYASFTRTNWSSIQQLIISNSLGIPAVEDIHYKDSNTVALGADYRLNEKLILRTGLAKDGTPTTDQYRSVRIPTTDRMIYGIGLGYTITPQTYVDLGYSLVKEDVAPINQSKPLNATLATNYSANFQTSANIAMLQLNHKF